jgi:hypothetical protein
MEAKRVIAKFKKKKLCVCGHPQATHWRDKLISEKCSQCQCKKFRPVTDAKV